MHAGSSLHLGCRLTQFSPPFPTSTGPRGGLEISDKAASVDPKAHVHQEHHRQEVLQHSGASLREHFAGRGQGGKRWKKMEMERCTRGNDFV